MYRGKIKIGVHLPNKAIGNVHLINPEKGNPGIGGTQFLLFSLPYYLNKYHPDKFEFIYFAEDTRFITTEFKVISIINLSDVPQKAKDTFCEVIIFRPSYDKETKAFLKLIKELQIKSIAWMHNTPVLLLNQLNRNKYISSCVCVGREQYESLRDHPIITKLSMIFNGFDPSNISDFETTHKTKSAVFLGSLTFAKGFHFWVQLWKQILKLHPDAELYVIGSGKLYDRYQKFGNLGIADEGYEKMFRKYISDEHGNIHPSIKFLGVLGPEKFKIMNGARVGLTNHPKLSETFCLAAVEFQFCETPVVSGARGGLLDTVKNGESGFLGKSKKAYIRSIDKLLADNELSIKLGRSGKEIVNEKFNFENISNKWANLINDVFLNAKIHILKNDEHSVFGIKTFRERLRILKSRYFVFNMLPASIYIMHTFESFSLRLERLRFKLNGFLNDFVSFK